MKPEVGTQTDLLIERIGIYGEGIAHLDGLTVFVDGALPDETVTTRLTTVKKNYAKATLLSIKEPSPHRTTPPCPVFGRCGGCQLQHLEYEGQLAMKRQRVADALERIGGLHEITVEPCLPSPQQYSYRNKIQLPVSGSQHQLELGLYAKRSHDVIDIEGCPIHCSVGEQTFVTLRKLLLASNITPYNPRNHHGELRHILIKSGVNTDQVLVVFVTSGKASSSLQKLAEDLFEACPTIKGVVQNINKRHDNVILGPVYTPLVGERTITETLCGLTFKVSPASFFQVNPPQAENLYQKAVEFANLSPQETALDAYCGVGTLSLLIAQQCKQVIGVESVPQAIDDANENARHNSITNATFISAPMEKAIETLPPTDVVFLNPPRKGCDPQVIAGIAKRAPQKIVYISCDPATLARDIALLHNYTVTTVQPVDMFPQTAHVETVALLVRSAS